MNFNKGMLLRMFVFVTLTAGFSVAQALSCCQDNLADGFWLVSAENISCTTHCVEFKGKTCTVWEDTTAWLCTYGAAVGPGSYQEECYDTGNSGTGGPKSMN